MGRVVVAAVVVVVPLDGVVRTLAGGAWRLGAGVEKKEDAGRLACDEVSVELGLPFDCVAVGGEDVRSGLKMWFWQPESMWELISVSLTGLLQMGQSTAAILKRRRCCDACDGVFFLAQD